MIEFSGSYKGYDTLKVKNIVKRKSWSKKDRIKWPKGVV